MKTNHRSLAAGIMLLSLAGLSPTADAEDTIQTGDGLLQMTATMPDEARVGEQFTYTVKLTNTSENVTLHDVELRQRTAKGFSIESISITGEKKNRQKNNQKPSEQSNAQQSESASSEQGPSASNSNNRMKIATLKPGESRTIEVTASADEAGELRSCLEIVNYKPAICLIADVVKPELEITKVAPKQADRCNVIELEYTVKNGGTGDVGTFQVVDALGDGLATIEGNAELRFDVDGLAAGETRKFIGRVYASKAGSFTSRAVAKAENSDLKSRSQKTTTNVIAADLDVRVEGPGRLYGNQLVTFTAYVTNTGNSPAEDVGVKVFWPEDANLADLGDVRIQKENTNGSANNGEEKQSQPTVSAKPNDDTTSNNQNSSDDSSSSSDDNSKLAMADKAFTISSLKPGQTAVFEYAVRPGDLKRIPTRVEARSVCTVDVADDQANAKSEAMATGYAAVKIVRLPAMQLVVFDDEDPVTTGSKVKYSIRVWNEGDADDQNVKLVAHLPDGLEFTSAEGPTEHSVKGSMITFKPIKTMEPGDRADYIVTAVCSGQGDVRFEAELSSKSLDKAVTVEEPTRLFGGK